MNAKGVKGSERLIVKELERKAVVMSKSLYKTLGVDETVDTLELKKAYRKKARETHPDLNGDDDSAFKEVALAYSVLSDDEKRKQYDETGEYSSNNSKADKRRAELIRLFMETITSGCNLNYTNIFEVVADKIKHEKKRVQNRIQNAKEIISHCENVLSRIESKEQLFSGVIEAKIKVTKQALLIEEDVLKDIPLMLVTLKKYKYRVDKKKAVEDDWIFDTSTVDGVTFTLRKGNTI